MTVRRTEKDVEYIETKFLLGINEVELKKIEIQFQPVIDELKTFGLDKFLVALQPFKTNN